MFITHDLDEALKLGDRIALMKDGKIVQIGTPEEIMTNPADEYVEKFVEDVDKSKVLTASNVMIRPETVDSTKHGPRVALQKMRKAGISSIYVVNRSRKLQGIITANAAMDAIKNGITGLHEVVDKDVPIVTPDVALHDLFNLIYDSSIPIPVVEDGILRGIIIKGTVLAALSGNGVNNIE